MLSPARTPGLGTALIYNYSRNWQRSTYIAGAAHRAAMNARAAQRYAGRTDNLRTLTAVIDTLAQRAESAFCTGLGG